MRTLELALPPSPPSLIPSFNYNNSTARTVGNDVRTNFDVQLLLRKPKRQKSEPVVVIQQPQIQTQKSIPRCSTSDILRLMDSLSLPGNEDLYSCLAKESARENDRRGAYELQVHILKSSIRPTTTFINRLLLMHVSCGRLDITRQMFDKMPHRDFHSWAIVFLGCIETGDYEDAALLFVSMLKHSKNGAFKIPSWIMGCVLKACAMSRDLALGKQVHGLCQKLGFIDDEDSYLSGSLIRFYGEFRCLEDANLVLHQLSNANTVVWAAKVTNDYREGEFQEVIRDFIEMGKHGVKKNVSVFSNVLKACTWVSDGGRSGQQVHANAIKLGVESDCLIQCRLIEMYGKYGKVKEAEQVFKSRKDETSDSCWNAMVAGYMQNGFYIEAIKLLHQMKATGIKSHDMLLNDAHF
ncbi:PREDICTED: pentatricopeptide repeat-containing protein At1g31790 [Camelina sativa]|uniref:Pentatricopeptide repeat-containing protein At1g31790 n=1 Tax=Camelina sativa TaxID=90675 RepID=A0ABM0WZY1_CAMSA|nr:PREDICTED: pentatricopeptide repeat-containing protein At1g31790 [Camelina sativa]